MIADCLTKRMKPHALLPAMRGVVDLTPTPESTLTKLRKSKLRRAKNASVDAEDGNGLVHGSLGTDATQNDN